MRRLKNDLDGRSRWNGDKNGGPREREREREELGLSLVAGGGGSQFSKGYALKIC